MKKTLKFITLLAIMVLLVVTLTGCTSDNTGSSVETNGGTTKQEVSNVSIEDFMKKLEEADLKINDKIKKSSELIGAKEGYGLEINGEYIEIYLYNTNSQEELTKSNIKSAKEKGIITMPSLDNYEMKAIYNKGLVLAGYEEHINKDKIIEIFNSL